MVSTENAIDRRPPAPTHHPAAELLVDYSSGALSPAESLLIALHLGFCDDCRRSVTMLSAVGGALLEAIAPIIVSPALFNRTLLALDARQAAAKASAKPRAHHALAPFGGRWPRVLSAAIEKYNLRKWRWLPAGFRALRIPFRESSARLWIMKAPGGRGPFAHSHVLDEWTVVLEGGFSDEAGTYAAGDFAYAGAGDTHTVVAEPGEGCVCVLLVRAPLLYVTWPGKLLAPFVRL